jgi:chemotaxis signal transduction protein
MNKEKKIWLFEQYAHKSWVIAISLTTEAARVGGKVGEGLAVVAEECRKLAIKIASDVGEVRFEGGKDDDFRGIADAAFQMNLLALNANLENYRMRAAAEKSDYRSMSVCVEEIRALACSIINLLEKPESTNDKPIPEVIAPLKSAEISDYFLQYSIGGIPFAENLNYIKEINYPEKITSKIWNLRGLEVPVIDLYKRFKLKEVEGDRQTVMILGLNGSQSHDNIYAVPVDGVYGIFISKIGYNVPPKAGHAFADYTRECWDVIGDDQLLFIDWQKFI